MKQQKEEVTYKIQRMRYLSTMVMYKQLCVYPIQMSINNSILVQSLDLAKESANIYKDFSRSLNHCAHLKVMSSSIIYYSTLR